MVVTDKAGLKGPLTRRAETLPVLVQVDLEMRYNRIMINIDNLVGRQFWFYGADDDSFCLGHVIGATPRRGTRGPRFALEATEGAQPRQVPVGGHDFFSRPLAFVRVVKVASEHGFNGYSLVDELDGHVWLRLGEDAGAPNGSTFVFDYELKAIALTGRG